MPTWRQAGPPKQSALTRRRSALTRTLPPLTSSWPSFLLNPGSPKKLASTTKRPAGSIPSSAGRSVQNSADRLSAQLQPPGSLQVFAILTYVTRYFSSAAIARSAAAAGLPRNRPAGFEISACAASRDRAGDGADGRGPRPASCGFAGNPLGPAGLPAEPTPSDPLRPD